MTEISNDTPRGAIFCQGMWQCGQGCVVLVLYVIQRHAYVEPDSLYTTHHYRIISQFNFVGAYFVEYVYKHH